MSTWLFCYSDANVHAEWRLNAPATRPAGVVVRLLVRVWKKGRKLSWVQGVKFEDSATQSSRGLACGATRTTTPFCLRHVFDPIRVIVV